MSNKSIFYRYPKLYLWGLNWIHGENFAKRYRYMAGFVKKGDSVLEPACGPGKLASFLPEESMYRGFDTNEEFIGFALKKGLKVKIGNVLEPKCFGKADVVIARDIHHHIKPTDRRRFINNCFTAAKRTFIICEPGKEEKMGTGFWDRLNNRLTEWSEKDGTNNVKAEYFLTQSQLRNEIKNGFGVIPKYIRRETMNFGEDIVAVFFKK